jgi:hypothetical protein
LILGSPSGDALSNLSIMKSFFYPPGFVTVFILSSLLAFASGESVDRSPERDALPARIGDHTNRALDILLHKVVVKRDYGGKLYEKNCAACHGSDRRGGSAPELSERTLKEYRPLDTLWQKIERGCPGSGAPDFGRLGAIKLIFIARHIKRPLPAKH